MTKVCTRTSYPSRIHMQNVQLLTTMVRLPPKIHLECPNGLPLRITAPDFACADLSTWKKKVL